MKLIMRITRILAALGFAAFILTASGCLVVSGSSTYESGVKITPTTLERIVVGQTTEAWVIATLGEPTEQNEVEGQPNVEIFKYEHTTHESSGGAVLFIFADAKNKSHKSVVYLEITDSVVSDYWTEQ